MTKKSQYFDHRNNGVTRQEAMRLLTLSSGSTTMYEQSYVQNKELELLKSQTIKNTSQAVAETVLLPPTKWVQPTIMMWVGVFISFLIIFIFIAYTCYILFDYFFPSDSNETSILENTLDTITKTAEERANDRYQKQITILDRELKYKDRKITSLTEENLELKRNCFNPSPDNPKPPAADTTYTTIDESHLNNVTLTQDSSISSLPISIKYTTNQSTRHKHKLE